MKSFMVSLLGLVLSVSVGAEPLTKGRVWLASGQPAAGVHVRLFDLTDLRRSVGTTTDEAGYFALPLATVGGPALPQGFALGQNYPNPFNPSTIIPYQIPTTTHVRLEVFNLLGQWLATLVDGERPAGAHTAHWDATDATGRAVGAGVFIYRLTSGGHTVSRRMVLIDGQAGIPAGRSGPRQPAAVGVKTEGSVYGLTVAGAGLIAYVDPAFRVGTDQVNLVLEQPGGQARMKVATGGILGDVNNDGQVDAFDVLYVALYSKDPSITLPNNGDISLGDVNGDGTVDLADGLFLALYTVNPSDPTLPPGIGQPVDGSGDDHGDTPSAATDLAVGSSRSGQIETGGDVDYFRVQVSESGELTVHTTGSLDTKGQLEDSAGAVLASDDDGGEGLNFRIAHAVSAGTYYIKVEGYNASATGSYTIHASGPVGDGPDLIVASASVSDNTLTPAQSFTLNATVRNQGTAAAAATTVHYYQSPDATITADDAQLGTDPVSGLPADHTHAVSADLTAPSSAGTYYYGACVQSVPGESNTDNNCSTGVQVTVGSGGGDDHGDTPSAATDLAVGSSRSGQIETGGDVDYFRVQVSESGELTVHTTGSLDTKGQLEDSAGAVLASNDDGGEGYNFRIAHTVSAGTYYIKVEGFDASTTGSYTIHASGPSGDGGPVNIPDANLRAVIAAALGKAPNAPITEDEMATLTFLEANEKGIRDLTGLEFATNLIRLNLIGNSITDLAPLSGLTNLTTLWLDGNNIADLAPLSGLTNLTELGLGSNNIADLAPLSGLTNLRGLWLDRNSISDLAPLVANTGLGSGDEVYLNDNPLSSTSINTHIPALESRGVTVHYDDDGGGDDHGDTPSAATDLAVGSSQSGQIETGGDVDYFRVQVSESGELTVHTTGSLDTKGQLEDSAGGVLASDDDGGEGYNFRVAHTVSAGTYYIKVEGYNASATGSYTIHASVRGGDDGPVNIPDDNLRAVIAEALGKAPNAPITKDEMATLTSLDAAEQGIRNLAGLEFATNLRRLGLSFNNIADVSPLEGLTNLTGLWLYANNIADVLPLEGLTRLEILSLGSNSIADVSPLEGLTRLEILSLSTNSIADVSPLEGLTNLRILYLRANNIANVSPLEGLTNLLDLYLSANNIADVSPLEGLTRLETMNLESNIIADVSPLVRLTNLIELDLRGNPLSVASINVHIAALIRRGTTVHFESFRQGDFDIELVYLDHFTEFQKRVVEYAARRWMAILPEDLQDIEFNRSVSGPCFDHSFTISRGERIDDLRIYVTHVPNDLPDFVAGIAGPRLIRVDSGQTIVGCLALRPVHRLSGLFRELALHEMGHVFGVGTLWNRFGFLQARFGDTHFNGPRAIAAFNSAGGRNYPGPKVPAEREVGAHWRGSVFETELMIPYLNGQGWLSAITVQSLADLGYSVDVTQADPYTLPAAQTSAEIASIDAWDDHLSEGLGLSTHGESELQCGVGSGAAREAIYVVNEQGAIIRTLGD